MDALDDEDVEIDCHEEEEGKEVYPETCEQHVL